MKQYFTFVVISFFFQNIAIAQLIWQEHFKTTHLEVLSTQRLPKGKSFNLVGILNDELHSMSLNNKKQVIENSSFDRKNNLSPQAIYSINNKDYLIAIQKKGKVQYGVVNLKGKEIWKQSFDFKGKINAICLTVKNEIVMVGEKDNRMFITKRKKNGQVIWEKSLGVKGALLGVKPTKDSGIIVVGYIDLYFSNETDFMIMKLDSNGKNKWERAYGEPDKVEKAYLVTIASNGHIVVVGSCGDGLWILQLNKEREVEWQEKIDEKGNKFIPTSICSMLNGQTVFTVKVKSKEKYSHLFIAKMNNSFGNVSPNLNIEFSLFGIFNNEKFPLDFIKKENLYEEVFNTSNKNINPKDSIEIYGKKSDIYQIHFLSFNKKNKAFLSPTLLSNDEAKSTKKLLAKIEIKESPFLIILLSPRTFNEKKIQRKLFYKKDLVEALNKVFFEEKIGLKNVDFKKNKVSATIKFEEVGILAFILKLK